MSIETIIIVILLLMLVGFLPMWPHSRRMGYYPSGGLGLVLVVVLVLIVVGEGQEQVAHRATWFAMRPHSA